VGAGGQEGRQHRHRQGDRGDGRPDLHCAERHHLEDGREEHHLHKSVFIGEIKADGQFNVVWKTPGPVKAQPWSPFIPENKGKKDEPVSVAAKK